MLPFLPARPLQLIILMPLVVGALLDLTPGGAVAADFPPLRSERPPFFTTDATISLDADGRPSLTVSVTIPYSELQWVRLEQGFGAGAGISISLQPRGGGRVYGDTWERRVAVPSFGGTISPNTALVDRRTFEVRPNQYRLRVTVQDLEAEERSSANEPIQIPDYSKVPVGFGDLELGVVDSAGAFTPNPTRRYGLDVSRLAARTALFDRRPGGWPRNYDFGYRILDESGAEIVTGIQKVTQARSAEGSIVRPSSSDLFIGSYQLEVTLEDGRSRWRVNRSFEVEQSGPPRGKEWDRMLEALSYIADARELQVLRNATPEQQAQAWDDFWRRRDPTPETTRNEALIEFFRRVRYAEQHFQGMGPGWRSDMGRIYIKFGPPEQVENRPASSVSPQLEIWYYNQPYRRFVFADREGFGRYVLVTPASE